MAAGLAQAPALDSPSASGSLSAMAVESGSSRKSEMGRPSTSPSQVPEGLSDNRPNLLVVEDNRADVLLVEEALRLYRVPLNMHVVEDGEEAIAFIERAEQDPDAPCPRLLLLDLNVPKKTGLEVLQRVRGSDRCKDIPVVIFTSSNSPQDRSETSRLGANRYFQKPTQYDQFLKIGQILKDVMDEKTT